MKIFLYIIITLIGLPFLIIGHLSAFVILPIQVGFWRTRRFLEELNEDAGWRTWLIIAFMAAATVSTAQLPYVLSTDKISLEVEPRIVKPDPCFFEVLDISNFKGNNLYDLLRDLQTRVEHCNILFVYNPDMANCYHVTVRKQKGVVLEIIEDSLRDTDLQLIVIPPRTVGISKIYRKPFRL